MRSLVASIITIIVAITSLITGTGATEITSQFYKDIVHYAHYAKLTSCIGKDVLQEGVPFSEGACPTKFCYADRNSETELVKVRVAGDTESGTSLVALDHKNKEVVVAFRSSTTTVDWISDFYILKTPYTPIAGFSKKYPRCEDCKVHLGFYQHMEAIYHDLIEYVLNDVYKEHPDYKLVVVGHSLGAAMAALTAIEFKMMGFQPQVYTFGGPKIFNEEMSIWLNKIFSTGKVTQLIKSGRKFESAYIRVVHDGDYVPKLPPKFRHAGVEIFITKKDLPHKMEDVEVIGIRKQQDDDKAPETTETPWDMLPGYEHRTYFKTINKCEDIDADY